MGSISPFHGRSKPLPVETKEAEKATSKAEEGSLLFKWAFHGQHSRKLLSTGIKEQSSLVTGTGTEPVEGKPGGGYPFRPAEKLPA